MTRRKRRRFSADEKLNAVKHELITKNPFADEASATQGNPKKLFMVPAEFVQTRYSHDANVLTTLEKIVTKAGLVPWPKLMQNRRATRETELLAHYPAKDVCSWLGNSPDVANKHYAMTMQASFNRAVQAGAKITGVTAALGPKTPQIPPQTLQESTDTLQDNSDASSQNPVNNWSYLAKSLNDLTSVPPVGLEPTTHGLRVRCSTN